ncbi:hypothetical protein A2999_00680 [Candidatus Wolfebacteria bacterium RIFCSPLOWO2_01_FULL_38_11]|uniref:Type 4 fimbrial biogenesis protein PilX N-terminal domain-containing protein n=1 Tax=Candidatus Wolfebacteria bacterium RIFCSPLOWO2_01_FULL_38_11 TaxID=1802556 RepID=A0A1F8DQ34_9BACT|nr:MAG: hypothetical protein A2999_00680 [Candidatus Wolfebacteria bacterium RIFCSPLOWO2_01_FULL_38_11]
MKIIRLSNYQTIKLLNYQAIKGIASLPTIMVITILILAIAIGITALAFNESIMSAAQVQSSKALFYAEAGARDALMRIARNKNYTCDSPSNGCYQIEFATSGCSTSEGCAKITVSSAQSPKVIISEGRVNNNIRKMQVDIYFDAALSGEIINTNWREIVD